ncbi:TC.FEV.OM [Acanthosepion pharaonis]|uniref:TC.FEV.OM n=1 Tax=Acanthosepion pharaonis TaxID=158019 RepID=A0A812DMK2_ACAPH|nr:TC.FEV.OM [Sepia pharaonis]
MRTVAVLFNRDFFVGSAATRSRRTRHRNAEQQNRCRERADRSGDCALPSRPEIPASTDLRLSLGETLASAGRVGDLLRPFGSRPILRGFPGERIRVLTDGIGAIDLSNTSVDHGGHRPALAERIEVLRGPSALLFGPSAVGGVVNDDTRIPRTRPENGYRLNGIATTARLRTSVRSPALLTWRRRPQDRRLRAIASGTRCRAVASRRAARRTVRGPDRLRGLRCHPRQAPTPPPRLTDASRVDHHRHGPTWRELQPLRQPLRRADPLCDRSGSGAGVTLPDVKAGPSRLARRGRDRGRISLTASASALAASYRHFELKPSGEIGTAFFSRGTEGDWNSFQADQRGCSIMRGCSMLRPALVTSGATRPPRLFGSDPRFWREAHLWRVFRLAGVGYGVTDAIRIGLNGPYTERAPSAEELFANGPHAGTQAYELGNPDSAGTGYGIEATLHVHGERVSFDASAYYNRFNNYISAAGRPRRITSKQVPAIGASKAICRLLFEVGGTRINADLLGDYVRATIIDRAPCRASRRFVYWRSGGARRQVHRAGRGGARVQAGPYRRLRDPHARLHLGKRQ